MSLSDLEGGNILGSEINNLDHVVSTNTKNNQVNDVIDNELKFDVIKILANNHVKYPLPILNISLRGGKKYRQTLNYKT